MAQSYHFHPRYGRLLCRPRKLLALPLPLLPVGWSLILRSLLDLPVHNWSPSYLHGALARSKVPARWHRSVPWNSSAPRWCRTRLSPGLVLHCRLLQHHHWLVSDLPGHVVREPTPLVSSAHKRLGLSRWITHSQGLRWALHHWRVSIVNFETLLFECTGVYVT